MSKQVAITGGAAVGCCLVAVAATIAEIWALVWAISDITNPVQSHPTLDIVVFVIVGLMLLGGIGNRAHS
jgi:predicted tellurium resistance membrane protein TerC